MTDLVLVGRSSSHFTRVPRIFALELGVPLAFRAVPDLRSLDAATYAGNPALKVPVLLDAEGPLFGAENICRALARRSAARVVLRGDVADRRVANAEELTHHVMATEVSILMPRLMGDDREAQPKLRRSLENALAYLDEHVDGALLALPADRAVSFLEASLFCALTHLPWRNVMDVAKYERLTAFSARFGERESARQTEYRFDAV